MRKIKTILGIVFSLANLLVKKPSHIEYKKPPIYYRNKDYL